jgi:outer membrane protein OmpA-like peptidoglycan-associated protein
VRDTIIVERIVRDTVYHPDTLVKSLPLVSRQPSSKSQPLQPALAPTSLDVPELRTARIFFATGSATINSQYTQVLNRAAAWMLKNPDRRVLITGATDATGSPAQNRVLAQKRIEAVKSALIKRGIDAGRFETQIQVSDTKSTQPSSSNRRVEMSAIR